MIPTIQYDFGQALRLKVDVYAQRRRGGLVWRYCGYLPEGGSQEGSAVMKRTMLLSGAVMIGVASFAADLSAQGVEQSVAIAKVDVQTVQGGYQASKVIGNAVVNDADQTIGKIDDLLVTRDGKEPYAVLSIGGFLGMGTKLVVVRYDSLQFTDKKIVLPGGSKDGLNMLSAFEYTKQ
jgi:hypothetical protein